MGFDFYNDDDNLVSNIEAKKVIYGIFFPILDKFFSNPIWTKLKLEIVLFQDRGYNWVYSKEKVDRYYLKKSGQHYNDEEIVHTLMFDAENRSYEIKYKISKKYPRGIILFPMKLAEFVYLNRLTCKEFFQAYLIPWISENHPGMQFIFTDNSKDDLMYSFT